MYDLNHSGFHLLGEVMEMASRFSIYSKRPISDLRRIFLPPIIYGKIRLYRSQQKLVGFATWTFLTNEESKNIKIRHDMFNRQNGDQVWVVDMCSQNNVFYIARYMRTFLTDYIMKYTGHKRAYWNRPHKISNAGRIDNGR